jgi:hypothetical protein
MSRINFSHLHGPNRLILSLTPLTVEQQEAYTEAPNSDSRFQMNINVYDSTGKLVHTAQSGRKLIP